MLPAQKDFIDNFTKGLLYQIVPNKSWANVCYTYRINNKLAGGCYKIALNDALSDELKEWLKYKEFCHIYLGHYAKKQTLDYRFSAPKIKAVYELRMMTLSGVCPNVLFCDECGAYNSDSGSMYFDTIENILYCPHCCFKKGIAHKCLSVSMGCITAVRFCITAEPKKILSFTLSTASMNDMEKFAERFFLAQNNFYCPTLDFYKNVKELK